ncbi:MAG TPA: transposase [Sphingobacterium sp.]|nr:transposase [Sphingobacterium sp.]
MPAAYILAETNAFALVKNANQLVSYAGLDIKLNQSGLKEGKTKISKQQFYP